MSSTKLLLSVNGFLEPAAAVTWATLAGGSRAWACREQDRRDPLLDAASAGFTQTGSGFSAGLHIDSNQYIRAKKPVCRRFHRSALTGCTKSGHRLVDGLHSIEKTDSCSTEFFIDSKTRRSTTRSFFDSFLSFSGWCGVRGSSVVTVLTARLRRRASKGL